MGSLSRNNSSNFLFVERTGAILLKSNQNFLLIACRKMAAASVDCVQGNEIINIGVGGAGVYLLNEFYSTIMPEHKIGKDGKFIERKNP